MLFRSGVRQKVKPGSQDGPLPDWPQPHGIFVNGTQFHARVFLEKLNDLHDKVLTKVLTKTDYSMEDQAFSRLLASRLKAEDGKMLFRLYDLEIVDNQGSTKDLITYIDGVQYLRVDTLQN